ncbi:MAG: FAD-dependent oxidoreductase, partial [Candidatus Bathyarchaeota archaeon]
GVQIGEDLSLEDLENQCEATFLATGAPLSKRLKIEGAELEGVLWGVEFLRDVNSGRDAKVGEKVLVIGGGNVAIDAARAALRLGAREVQLACLECREEMPAHKWQIEEAIEEGAILKASWGPKRILGDGNAVTGAELVRCTAVFDKEGRFNPSFDEEETTSIEADTVIIAIGQASDLSFLHGKSDIQATRGSIEVGEGSLQTGSPKIFAGGDVVTGAASVVEAIAAGRKAAISIDAFLGGDGAIDEALTESGRSDPWLGREEDFAKKKRVEIPYLPLERRLRDFSLVELSLNEEMAVEEAKRCLRCDLRLEISPVALPPEKWLEFSAESVSVAPETSGVYQLLDEKKLIIYIAGTPNLRKDLEQQLQTVKKARYFGFEEDPMYTKRESELMQKFLKEHGKMPEMNEELLDLF